METSAYQVQTSQPSTLQNKSQSSAIVPIVERYKDVGTIAQAFVLPEPAIATMAKKRGLDKVKAAFVLQFSRFAADLHVKDTLTEGDIDFIVDVLTTDENYKWLKVADIAILFKRIRMNKYGKLYQSMNTGTFFECLDKYCIERNGEIERLRAEEAAQLRDDMRSAIKLSYFINKEGRVEFTEEAKAAAEEKRIRQEQIEAETRRKVEVAKQTMMAYEEQ